MLSDNDKRETFGMQNALKVILRLRMITQSPSIIDAHLYYSLLNNNLSELEGLFVNYGRGGALSSSL